MSCRSCHSEHQGSFTGEIAIQLEMGLHDFGSQRFSRHRDW